MRILAVHRPSSPGKGNPFVSSQVEELRLRGHEVEMSVDRFWSGEGDYDIVHFHWPKVLFGERWVDVNARDVACFESAIASFRSRGARIFYTRHNAEQHYGETAVGLARIYDILDRRSDAVIHMGNFSRRELVGRIGVGGSGPEHFMIPHPVYHSMPRDIPSSSARRRLGIPEHARVVLCFGGFRAHEEREMVWRACRECGVERLELVAPRFFKGSLWRGRGVRGAWREWRYRRSFALPSAHYDDSHVLEDDIPFYFAAADVVLIQRKRILNSGNLPMGFYFGKPVVGPDVGNVGEILSSTGNPVFDPENAASVAEALTLGFEYADAGLGKTNRGFADREWSLRKITDLLEHAYVDVVSRGECKERKGK